MIPFVRMGSQARLLCTRLFARENASTTTNRQMASANGIKTSTRQGLNSTKRTNSGRTIPVLGLGAWLLDSGDCGKACSWAIQHGYHHIDTASCYENEVHVGEAVKACTLPREELFITTKLWTPDHGRKALDACKVSLKR